ncbi:helix-turn-helix transcriptional regulator [Streptomyces triculaminicus]|uniref:helix-turn-helix transcriptional regulator n=1 Tax=Streptomyces triculaminicus TaxID=2816232 RepID=UPI0033E56933
MPTTSQPRPGAPLTDREVQILHAASLGHSLATTAAALGLSTNTIKSHRRSICIKLGARDRAHAVAIGFRCRILDTPTGRRTA